MKNKTIEEYMKRFAENYKHNSTTKYERESTDVFVKLFLQPLYTHEAITSEELMEYMDLYNELKRRK